LDSRAKRDDLEQKPQLQSEAAAAETQESAEALLRLNKVLAERGVGSRRHCDAIISSGAVRVNGRAVTELGTKVDPDADRIEVDGKILSSPRHVVYALNKPAGVVCTSAPEESRPRAIDLVRDQAGSRLFCVGRLDVDSEGLILLTNDGDFANRVAHPRYGVTKSYFVKVRGRLTPADVERLTKGVWLSEGRTRGARVWVKKRLATATVLLITIREGMNREIRRIFAKLGFNVTQLRRVAIGDLSLRGIGLGEYRPLSQSEVRSLLSGSAAAGEPTIKNLE
jgi:23S rRNA pseudouridine2605 synthase